MTDSDIDKRLNYFTGEFLQEQDFRDEQAYHIDRQRRHNRFLHTPGYADGLMVDLDQEAPKITVRQGTALDGSGRLIVLRSDKEGIPINADRNGIWLVLISYGERLDEESKASTRIIEEPLIEIVLEKDFSTSDTEHIPLTRLRVDSNGTVTKDDSVRRRAGVTAGDMSGNLRVAGTIRVNPGQGDQAGLLVIHGASSGAGVIAAVAPGLPPARPAAVNAVSGFDEVPGLYVKSPSLDRGMAAIFDGPVTMNGPLTVAGPLSGRDGPLRISGSAELQDTMLHGALKVEANHPTTLGGPFSVAGASSFAGNVDIGTTSPGSRLQVGKGSSKAAIGECRVGEALDYATAYVGFNAVRSSSGEWLVDSDTRSNGGAVIFGGIYHGLSIATIPSQGTNGGNVSQKLSDQQLRESVRMRITSTGDVGIGTTTPRARLDVNGEIRGTAVRGASWSYTEKIEFTEAVSTNSTSWVEIQKYTRTIPVPALSNLVVTLHIPFVGNEMTAARSRIRLNFDDQMVSDATKYNSDTFELHEITLTGLIKNITAGDHTIRLFAAVDKGKLNIPLYTLNLLEHTLAPAMFANLYLIGWY